MKSGKYLITSRSGAGKSTVCAELVRRGLPAFDGDDIPGLASWIDRANGQPVKMDYSQPVIEPSKFAWNWDETTLANLLKDRSQIFICGSADNSENFFDRFDTVFVLTLDPETQRQRILARTSHSYGKSPAMRDIIVKEQAEFAARAMRLGAIPIDAVPPVTEVVDTILEQL
jgi:hypothetical protein